MNLSMCAMVQSIFQLYEYASSICAFRSPPQGRKMSACGLFRMFQLTHHSPREALLIASDSSYRTELWFIPSGQRTSSGGAFGLRWPLRSAVRAGHILDYKGVAFVSLKMRIFSFAQSDKVRRSFPVRRPPADSVSRTRILKGSAFQKGAPRTADSVKSERRSLCFLASHFPDLNKNTKTAPVFGPLFSLTTSALGGIIVCGGKPALNLSL